MRKIIILLIAILVVSVVLSGCINEKTATKQESSDSKVGGIHGPIGIPEPKTNLNHSDSQDEIHDKTGE